VHVTTRAGRRRPVRRWTRIPLEPCGSRGTCDNRRLRRFTRADTPPPSGAGPDSAARCRAGGHLPRSRRSARAKRSGSSRCVRRPGKRRVAPSSLPAAAGALLGATPSGPATTVASVGSRPDTPVLARRPECATPDGRWRRQGTRTAPEPDSPSRRVPVRRAWGGRVGGCSPELLPWVPGTRSCLTCTEHAPRCDVGQAELAPSPGSSPGFLRRPQGRGACQQRRPQRPAGRRAGQPATRRQIPW
jgi:hypothetical protein